MVIPSGSVRRLPLILGLFTDDANQAWHTFYPPMKICINADCLSRSKGTLLKKEESRRVVAFTLSDGAHPAWSVHLRCRACHTNYHHNYSVHQNIRTYYSDVPAYLQVAEHQFVQRELAMQWIDLMQVAYVVSSSLQCPTDSQACTRVSATNCARLYNIAEARRATELKTAWQFSTSLTTEQVWDTFCLLSLLDDHAQRHVQLTLPHDGNQKDRYSAAMRARTERMIIHGQEELPHACDGCVRIFRTPAGEVTKTEVVVTDGVTIGRPCCAVPRCTNPLGSTRHRFCTLDPSHRRLEFTCAVEGCGRPVSQDGTVTHKSCDDPLHLKLESLNHESVASGKSKGQRERIAKLDDTFVSTETNSAVPVQDGEVWFEHDARNDAVRIVEPVKTTSTGVTDLPLISSQSLSSTPAPTTTTQCTEKTLPKKVKATFRRQRTNNEQLLVRPCGVINGRGTMYNHEAVSNVLVHIFIFSCLRCLIFFYQILVEQLYSLPRARKPEHLIYDSNCNALREVTSRNLTFFKDMGMCVDAFHHKTKHKASDRFCQENCDMRAYPELVDEHGKYYFNSSIVEQTNVWFGAFHNICCEMTAVKYNFFLDEMILRRNRFTVATLQGQGKHPLHPRLSI